METKLITEGKYIWQVKSFRGIVFSKLIVRKIPTAEEIVIEA